MTIKADYKAIVNWSWHKEITMLKYCYDHEKQS